jgi:HEPN domain-containing protein
MSDAKTQLVQSWLTKAQHDLASATAEPPLLDTAIYHCQQAAEKAVKGYLAFRDRDIDRTHDAELLIRTAMPYAQEFEDWIEAGIVLTPYARMYRYPGFADEPSQEEFEQAFSVAEGIYEVVLSLIPLP